MYAIIQDGGKQYKVEVGMKINLEKKNCEVGKTIEFPDVLFCNKEGEISIGKPRLENVRVEGVVEEHFKGPKITVFKFKRRKGCRRKKGHRQLYTRVRISNITVS